MTGADLDNAFGRCRRVAILEEVLEVVPGAAAFLSLLWVGGSAVFQQVDNSWHEYRVVDGLWQGCAWSALAFALAVLGVSKRFSLRMRREGRYVRLFLFLDDILMMSSLADLGLALEALTEELAVAGLQVSWPKTRCMHMRCREGADERLGAMGLEEVQGEIEILGSDLADDMSTSLRQMGSQAVPAATLRRVEAAEHLCSELRDLVSAPTEQPPVPAAWAILRLCVASALSYDQAIHPAHIIQPAVDRLDAAIDETLLTLLGSVGISARIREQVGWAGEFGGFSLPRIGARSHLLLLASLFRFAPGADQRCGDWCGCGCVLSAVSGRVVEAVAALAEQGWGFANEDLQLVSCEQIEDERWPWSCLAPDAVLAVLARAPVAGVGKLTAAWSREVDRLQAEAQYSVASSQEERARLLAVRTQVGARWLTESTADMRSFSTPVWRIAARLRLGLAVAEAGQCSHKYVAEDSRCAAHSDALGIHAACCAVGGLRLGRHHTIVRLLQRWAKEAGFQVNREMHVREWRRPKKDGSMKAAIMDLVCGGHTSLPARWVDVTVRHPLASTYIDEAERTAGAALAAARRDKLKNYPTRDGMHCTVFGLEVYGRITEEAAQLITEWAGAASQEKQALGLPARSARGRWLTELSAQLAWHTANAILVGTSDVQV